jgi:hypothetical protein
MSLRDHREEGREGGIYSFPRNEKEYIEIGLF